MSLQQPRVLNQRGAQHWLSERARDEWAERAQPLAADLQEELEGRAEVVLDLWPLNEPGRR